jgi:hypothetical protein
MHTLIAPPIPFPCGVMLVVVVLWRRVVVCAQIGNMEQDTVFMLCCVLLTLACLCQHRLLILAAGNISLASACHGCAPHPWPPTPLTLPLLPSRCLRGAQSVWSACVRALCISPVPACALTCSRPHLGMQCRVLCEGVAALCAGLVVGGSPDRESAGLGLDHGEVDDSLASKEDASA